MTDESVRRPTHFERLWLRDIFLVGLSVYAFSKTRTLWQTGYMHGLMKQLTEKIATDAQDHIVEPLTDLSKYLFEKIRKDADLIVTRRELDESRKDLRDMLLDYREKYGIQGIGAQPSQAPAEGEESSPLSLLANTVDKVTGIAKGVVGWLSPDDRDGDKTALSAADKAAEKPMDSQIKKEFNDAFMDARRRVEKAAKSVSLPGKSRAVPTTSSTSSSSSEPPKPAVKKVKVPSVDSAVAAPGPTPSPSSVANVPSHRPSSSSTSSSSSSKSAPASTASDAGVVVSTVDEVSDEMLEYTMDRVMERYKEEVKSPMQGVIFGSLASSSLIQAQKMKVMSESAMLRLDQVLASNQLTMAATAAIPSFAILAVGFYGMKRFFTRSPPSKGETTLNLRLALTDVERSLREVHCVLQSSALLEASSSTGQLYGAAGSSSGVLHQEGTNPKVSPRASRKRASMFTEKPQGNKPDKNNNSGIPNPVLSSSPLNTSDSGFAPYPLQRVTSMPGINDTFRFSENQNLISRGNLCINILALRKELVAAFTPRYRTIYRYFLPSYWLGFDTFNYHPNQSWSRAPFRMLVRFWAGEGASLHDDMEMESILVDMMKLESPDDEVSGQDKILIANRMRNSYRCFSIL